MPTAFDNIYAAAVAIMGDVNTAATGTVVQAPTNYGDDFRIPAGTAMFQVRLVPQPDTIRSSNLSHPTCEVIVAIHHYVLKNDALANEKLFLHEMMSIVADKLLEHSVWAAESGVYGFDLEGTDPVIEDGDRIGNVITFEVSATVLADAT